MLFKDKPSSVKEDKGLSSHSPPKVMSEQLFCGASHVMIEHAGELYCLRITRNEKLILTKNG